MQSIVNSPSPRKATRPHIWLALLFLTSFLIGTRDLASAQTRSEPYAPSQSFAPPPDTSILPFTYVQMNSNSLPVYAELSDAALGGLPNALYGAGFVWMSLADPNPIYQDGRIWYKIRPDGYVPAEAVTVFQPSEFQGSTLAQPSSDRLFGWIVFGIRPSGTAGAAPPKTAPLLPRYAPVTIYEEQIVGDWTWYRIGDNQWVEQRQVGIVKASARPDGVAPGDKWIEVNLYEQTLAAYEGDHMVYATLVSSGLRRWATPAGLTRIWAKAVASKMSGREGYPDYYFLQDVPWIMYFNRDVALHGAYWHDRFGAPHSHGCVNLSPKDARWLFNWTTPSAGPNNWTLPKPDNPGTWVWVHN